MNAVTDIKWKYIMLPAPRGHTMKSVEELEAMDETERQRYAHYVLSKARRQNPELIPNKCPCKRPGFIHIAGHHDDYTQPLRVAWMCGRCHSDFRRYASESPKWQLVEDVATLQFLHNAGQIQLVDIYRTYVKDQPSMIPFIWNEREFKIRRVDGAYYSYVFEFAHKRKNPQSESS